MNYQKIFFLTLFIAAFYFKIFSQTQPIFYKIDQSKGLSSSRITGIVKEKNGFIWISTQNGLNRYDGFSVKIYNKQNSNIESNDISSLFLDSNNRIWLTSSGGGLSFYNRKKNQFISYKNIPNNQYSIESNRVNAIIEHDNDFFWIATEKGLSLFNFKSEKFKRYIYKENEKLNITSIYKDKKGYLWLGTFSKGLFLFDIKTKNFINLKNNNKQLTTSINTISELNSDKILLGTSGSGLLTLDLLTHKITTFFKENSILSDKLKIVRSIKKDSKGNLWIGTDGYGLFEIQYPNSKNPNIKNYMYNAQLASSLAGNAIYVITEDDDKNIWIGTAWNGISILDKKNQTEIMLSDFIGLNPSPVLSIYQNDKNIYLGLDGNGLNIYNKATKQTYYYDNNKIKAKYIQKIIQTEQDILYLGTFGNGLLQFNEKTKKVIKYKSVFNDVSSLGFDDVRDIIEDENKNLWIATWGGGLNYFDVQKGAFTRYNLLNNNLVSIKKEQDNIWIASFGGGLSVFDIVKKEFKNFNFKENDTNSISSNNLFSLLKDSKGYLWIGTSGAGVNRLNLKTYKIESFQDVENIKYKNITSIIEDEEQNIWFGTKKGIAKYDYTTNKFSTFTNLSGDFHLNSNYKDKDGFLYFGGINGVLKFNPKYINDNNLQPKVSIRNFKIFNKEANIGADEILKENITSTKEITLEHFHNVITFEFSALKFPISENCEYAIMMQNFDDDWRTIGTDRTATFTNLSSGKYIFKVKSKEIGANWGEDFTAITLIIQKPYWLSWWAFLIYIIIGVLLFYVFRKYIIAWERLKSNLKLEKLTHEKDTELYNLKQRFFTNISHEIRTPVTLIISSINRLFDTGELLQSKQIKSAHTIRRNSNILLRLVNELLDVRKLQTNDIVLNTSKGEFVSFCKEIFLSFSEVAKDRNIKYTFNSNESKIYLMFDKNQLEKVLFNLLTNAFKFTKNNGTITLCINSNTTKVTLTVKDSGIGINTKHIHKIFNRFYQIENTETAQKTGFGLGLSISKEIMELHKGSISVDSKRGEGSTFKITLDKNNIHLKNNIDLSTETVKESTSIKKMKEQVSNQKAKKETILIVEDNLEIQESLKEILIDNYNIHQAFNGEEGLEIACNKSPNLIISDVMMPVMDGIEFSKKLKLHKLTSHIPIIILTAKTSIKDKMEGFNTGADEYITKPYDEDFLKNRIKNLLNSRKLLKEKFVSDHLLNPKELAISSLDQVFLEKLYKALENNLQANNLKAETISALINMSHSSMYKKIKALTGLTYIEFIRDYRLSIAKQLIEENGYSVSDACYKVGYSDRKYFSKLFKKKFKKNPSEFFKS